MHQSIPSANTLPGNPRGFAKYPNLTGRDLYKSKLLRGPGIYTKNFKHVYGNINSTYEKLLTISVSLVPHQLIATTLFQSAFRHDIKYERNSFVLVVDSMYGNCVRKIVVSAQIVRELIRKDQHMNLSKL